MSAFGTYEEFTDWALKTFSAPLIQPSAVQLEDPESSFPVVEQPQQAAHTNHTDRPSSGSPGRSPTSSLSMLGRR